MSKLKKQPKNNPLSLRLCFIFMSGVFSRFLTRQEVALSIQDFLDVSDPDLLDVDIGGLQGETLRRATARQDELTGIVIHTFLQTQVGYLWERVGKGKAVLVWL